MKKKIDRILNKLKLEEGEYLVKLSRDESDEIILITNLNRYDVSEIVNELNLKKFINKNFLFIKEGNLYYLYRCDYYNICNGQIVYNENGEMFRVGYNGLYNHYTE